MSITDQQWIDHANQNNAEFSNRQVLLKGDGPPVDGLQEDPATTKAPYGAFYKDRLTDNRYEQIDPDPVNNGYTWRIFSGSSFIVDRARSVLDIRSCTSDLNVGDLVMESKTNYLTVDKVEDNLRKRLVIGICVNKLDAVTAEILFKGPLLDLTGYTPGSKIYLSITGKMTSVIPLNGYMQVLGNCSDGTHIDFNPSTQHLLRSN